MSELKEKALEIVEGWEHILSEQEGREILSLYDKVEQLERREYEELKGIMKKLDEFDELQQQNEMLISDMREIFHLKSHLHDAQDIAEKYI